MHPCIGYSDERIELFLARDLRHVGHARDDGEFIEVLEVPVPRALAWMREGRITDSKALIGLHVGRPDPARGVGLGTLRRSAARSREARPGGLDREGGLEQVALPVLGAHLQQQLEGLGRLDPLGDDLLGEPWRATSFSAFTKMRLPSSVARSRMKLPSILR